MKGLFTPRKRGEVSRVLRPGGAARARRFVYRPVQGRGRQAAIWAGILLCAAAALFCLWQLGDYAWDYFTARRSDRVLREAYYSLPGESAPAPAEATEESSPSPSPEASPTPVPPPAARLSPVPYPHNPFLVTGSRFRPLLQINPDVKGWLSIEGLLDEAVVQRDNVYYITHDSTGEENVNGAVFLDEGCPLDTRPYTLMLYGHNMKTGMQFGALRNYEHLSFYRANPFLSFDSLYEEGRYVIFSVATVSMLPDHWRYVDFARLRSSTVRWREEAIHSLQALSLYGSSLDVRADDQLLLLITCVENDDERRIVAARRIREGEKEEQLRSIVRGAYVRER